MISLKIRLVASSEQQKSNSHSEESDITSVPTLDYLAERRYEVQVCIDRGRRGHEYLPRSEYSSGLRVQQLIIVLASDSLSDMR